MTSLGKMFFFFTSLLLFFNQSFENSSNIWLKKSPDSQCWILDTKFMVHFFNHFRKSMQNKSETGILFVGLKQI